MQRHWPKEEEASILKFTVGEEACGWMRQGSPGEQNRQNGYTLHFLGMVFRIGLSNPKLAFYALESLERASCLVCEPEGTAVPVWCRRPGGSLLVAGLREKLDNDFSGVRWQGQQTQQQEAKVCR